jgi:putative ABC transport system substrate-binding protein
MQFDQLKRREFITVLGGAAAWPLAARAQQPEMPVIGFLHAGSPTAYAHVTAAFRQGLKEVGYVERQNVAIEFRWADDEIDRLSELATDLVRHRVAVIATPGSVATPIAAKAATPSIPIVFCAGWDPVQAGLVAGINRPGGNVTGISFLNTELVAKRLELLHELVPGAVRVAVLVNPVNAPNSESTLRDVDASGRAIGLQIQVVRASTSREIDAIFATLAHERPDALFVSNDGFFYGRRVQLAILAAQRSIPASYATREFAETGGLMSYGASLADAYRQMGAYVDRILKGEKPGDLPVQAPTKYELVINLNTAKALGLEIPPTIIARADEVIE